MVQSGSFLALILGVAAVAASHFPRDSLDGTSLEFSSCFEKGLECALFATPLDYANPSAGNASLAVIRYKATRSPRLGTLWVNPGGPGGSGVELLLGGTATALSNLTGGYFDIASWDPRGVGFSLPRVECFHDADEEAQFWSRSTLVTDGVQAPANFTDPNDISTFYGQIDIFDELLIELGQRCSNLSGDALKYVGTAAAARDMLAMTEALDGPDALVNYWGFSYGTAIGSFFINMFPDRVGRLVLDGVVNPVSWTQEPIYEFWGLSLADSDKTLTMFANACAQAGPDACAISNENDGPGIYQWISNLIDAAYAAHKSGSHITSESIRSVLFDGMYAPRRWGPLADWLAGQYEQLTTNSTTSDGNSTLSKREMTAGDLIEERRSAKKRRGPFLPIPSGGESKSGIRPRGLPPRNNETPSYSSQAVTCGDSSDANYTTTDVFHEVVRVSQQVSNIFGPQTLLLTTSCEHWPARAVERFTGPFNHALKTPIIVIGNDADPITPLRSAEFVADQLGSSAYRIEEQGAGHASIAEHSDCTINALSTYFISGELPSSNVTQCAVDQPLFTPGDLIGGFRIPLANNTPVTENS